MPFGGSRESHARLTLVVRVVIRVVIKNPAQLLDAGGLSPKKPAGSSAFSITARAQQQQQRSEQLDGIPDDPPIKSLLTPTVSET
jgi:hypothetical protein